MLVAGSHIKWKTHFETEIFEVFRNRSLKYVHSWFERQRYFISLSMLYSRQLF